MRRCRCGVRAGIGRTNTVRNGTAAYRVIQIIIFGVMTPAGVQKVPPSVQFAVTPVEELDV